MVDMWLKCAIPIAQQQIQGTGVARTGGAASHRGNVLFPVLVEVRDYRGTRQPSSFIGQPRLERPISSAQENAQIVIAIVCVHQIRYSVTVKVPHDQCPGIDPVGIFYRRAKRTISIS